jgi:hypothetical protein
MAAAGARLVLLLLAGDAVPRKFEAMRLIKRCVPNQLMRDFPMRGQV